MKLVLLSAVAALAFARSASAQQCGATISGCRNCHEVQGARPVIAGPLPWHVDHAFADFCASCHGGDPRATEASLAHAGVTSPLADARGRCGACHGAGAEPMARRYLASRTRSPAPAPAATPTRPRPRMAVGNLVLAALVLLVGLGGAGYIVRNERRRGGTSS